MMIILHIEMSKFTNSQNLTQHILSLTDPSGTE